MKIDKVVKEILASLTRFEELTSKKPELFKTDESLELTEDQMNKLVELDFLGFERFVYRHGKYVLWIDWMNDKQLDEVATILLR